MNHNHRIKNNMSIPAVSSTAKTPLVTAQPHILSVAVNYTVAQKIAGQPLPLPSPLSSGKTTYPVHSTSVTDPTSTVTVASDGKTIVLHRRALGNKQLDINFTVTDGANVTWTGCSLDVMQFFAAPAEWAQNKSNPAVLSFSPPSGAVTFLLAVMNGDFYAIIDPSADDEVT